MLTLGSLFDGSGGFPLAGVLRGIEPVWASDIEPFPVRVTQVRFPQMRHYGDVCQMDGGKVEPVDIISFGSPCQDMSNAGQRAGLTGARSILFYEAIRIIKEMRDATGGKYPRWAVWENVKGAFSSNGGEDFRLVLQAFCQVKDEAADVPRSPGKWTPSGSIVGDGFSLCWRLFDAQFWGVPQHRERIYLVADFASECSAEILFESDILPCHFAEVYSSLQGAAIQSARCVGETGRKDNARDQRGVAGETDGLLDKHWCFRLYAGKGKNPLWTEERTFALNTAYRFATNETQNYCVRTSPGENQRPIYTEDVAFTVKTTNGYGVTDVKCYEDHRQSGSYNERVNAPTLTTQHGPNGMVHCYENHNLDGRVTEVENSPSIRAEDAHKPLVYQSHTHDARYTETGDVSPTLNQALGTGGMNKPLVDTDAIYSLGSDMLNAGNNMGISYNNGEYAYQCMCGGRRNGVGESTGVRQFTPTECGRLQGFPDWWCEGLECDDPSDELVAFWRKIFAQAGKPNSDKQIRRFLAKPRSDTAEYKMWGNGIALPCALYVMQCIAYYGENTNG